MHYIFQLIVMQIHPKAHFAGSYHQKEASQIINISNVNQPLPLIRPILGRLRSTGSPVELISKMIERFFLWLYGSCFQRLKKIEIGKIHERGSEERECVLRKKEKSRIYEAKLGDINRQDHNLVSRILQGRPWSVDSRPHNRRTGGVTTRKCAAGPNQTCACRQSW